MARSKQNADSLKQTIKEAFREALIEQRDLIREAVAEALEDMALSHAIREGKKTKPATREEVFQILRGKA